MPHKWIAVQDELPPEYTDVEIRLKDNPLHNPGLIVRQGEWWAGYERAYGMNEVSHWRYPPDYSETDAAAVYATN